MISSDRPSGPTGLCAAPYTSLRFEPDGRVSVCCVNGQYPLSVEKETIREIWDGSRLARLRTSLDSGDYSLAASLRGRPSGWKPQRHSSRRVRPPGY